MIRSFVLPVALSLAAVSAVPAFAMDTPPADPGTPGSSTSSGGGTASSSSGGGSGSPTSIPEPGMIGLFALGTMGVIAARRMRRRN